MEYKYSKDKRYVTRGINADVPIEIQLFIWNCIDELIESDIQTDYLSVFKLKIENSGKLFITHTQENPEYKNVIEIEMKEEYFSLDGVTVFVIDDITHSTALLSNEY